MGESVLLQLADEVVADRPRDGWGLCIERDGWCWLTLEGTLTSGLCVTTEVSEGVGAWDCRVSCCCRACTRLESGKEK